MTDAFTALHRRGSLVSGRDTRWNSSNWKKPGPAPEAERYSREAAAARKAGDFAKAPALSEKAAELGHAAAQFNCGVMNYHGKGTAMDKATALHWFEQAAEQGYVKAQFNCGLLYDRGEGTAVDKARAKAYFQMAADQAENQDAQTRAAHALRKFF